MIFYQQKNISYGWLAGMLGVLLVVFWVLEAIQPYYFLSGDNPAYFLPSYVYNWRAVIEHGQIPHLNFHQAVGQAYIGQGQNGVFYLPIYGAVWLSLALFGHELATIEILALAHLAAGATGMWFLLRRLGANSAMSAGGGLLWVTFPWFLGLAKEWINLSYLVAFLPWLWLAWERWRQNLSKKTTWQLAAITAVFFYQGYVQYVLMVFIFEVLCLVFTYSQQAQKKSKEEIIKILSYYSLHLFLFVLLTGPQLLPLWHAQQKSLERSAPINVQEMLATTVDIMGFIKAQGGYFTPTGFHPERYTQYVGWLVVGLMAAAFFQPLRKGFIERNLILYPLLAIIALLASTALHAVFYFIPLVNLFRFPTKYFSFFIFFTVISAMLAANEVIKLRPQRKIKFAVGGMIIASLFLNFYILLQYREDNFRHWGLGMDQLRKISQVISNDGRVFTFGLTNREDTPMGAYMTFNYATLTGRYHFNGYDPLMARANARIVGTEKKGRIILPTEGINDVFKKWSVKYLVAPNIPEYRKIIGELDGDWQLTEMDEVVMGTNQDAWPMVRWETDSAKPSYEMGINDIRVTAGLTNLDYLNIAIAPLALYKYEFDGIDQGWIAASEAENPIRLAIPPGVKEVRIYYYDAPFYVGVIMLGVGLLLLAALWRADKPGIREQLKGNTINGV